LLGGRSTLERSKYHFSQRQRFRRCRKQTLVSSWAPVQWLRRGRRAPVTMMPPPTSRFGSCHCPPVSQPLRRGLTLPSNGHPTAGHTDSLRQGQSRRWLPLMSHVRAQMTRWSKLTYRALLCLVALPAFAGPPPEGANCDLVDPPVESGETFSMHPGPVFFARIYPAYPISR
jgi:hypothetical protein